MSPNLNRYPLVRSIGVLSCSGSPWFRERVSERGATAGRGTGASIKPARHPGGRCHRATHRHHPRHHRDPSNPRKNKRWMYSGSDRRARAHHR